MDSVLSGLSFGVTSRYSASHRPATPCHHEFLSEQPHIPRAQDLIPCQERRLHLFPLAPLRSHAVPLAVLYVVPVVAALAQSGKTCEVVVRHIVVQVSASFIVGAINAGIVAVGLSGFWTQLIYGLIIVISVITQTVVGKKLA